MFDLLANKFSSIFSRLTGSGKLDENAISTVFSQIEDALFEADVPYAVVKDFLGSLKQEVTGQARNKALNQREQLIKLVHDKILYFLGGAGQGAFSFAIPSTIMIMGLQGSGKTTTIGKLAHFVQQAALARGKKRKILIASVDFYRPAAHEQLKILAQQAQVDFYQPSARTPVEAAVEIYAYSQSQRVELLILDTAGRLNVDAELIKELQVIDARLKPKYKLLVLDAMTGQESLSIAQTFEDALNFTGAIITKMDSNTRGGALFAFKHAIKKPILFVGQGEKIDDLEQFKPERIATRMLGMGDMQSLLEKAQQKIQVSETESMYASFKHGKLTLQDFAQQLSMVDRLGSLSSIVKYLPGASQLNLSDDTISKGESEIKKFRAIIGSMTLKERTSPQIIDNSRKERIARGAGVSVSEITLLLTRFEQSQQFVKMFKKMGSFNNVFK
ncbi:MAG: signal recognition particle receptor subunit alpha [Candidatus Babeliaceae bacterium]|jgi:signal recognition particle subunit SRP54